MRIRGVLLTAGAVLLAAACNALTGVADLLADREVDGSAPIGDGGSDGPATDAPSVVACGSDRVCMPNDGGWSPIVRLAQTTSSCPAEYPISTTLLGVPRSTRPCTCACTPVGGGCSGRFDVASASTPTCAATTTSLDLPLDGGCATVAPAIVVNTYVKVTTPETPPASCTGVLTSSFAAPAETRVCGGSTPTASSSCAGGEACVPAAVGSADNCIVHDGDVTCPDRFTTRLTLGGDPQDTRACGICTCSTTACSTGAIVLSDTTTCGFGGSRKANGSCGIAGAAAGTIRSAKITTLGGCRVTGTPAESGTITFNAPRTVCCLGSGP